MASTTSKVVLVTGGDKNIGYETVKALVGSAKAYHVIMGSRSMERAKQAIEKLHTECPEATNTVESIQLDISSDESIEKAFETVKTGHGRLDALVNNAGAAFDPDFIAGKLSLRDCFNKAYDVNVAGTHVMTWTFIPLMLKSADPRLIFVGGLSQITQAAEEYFPTPPQPAGWPKQIAFETIGYRCSKTALNMLMLDWNHKLKEDGVKVWGVMPGFLATDLGNMGHVAKEMGAGHPSIGGKVLQSVVEGERDADVGKLIEKDGISAY